MKQELLEFNLNEYIHVRLTDYGRKILLDRHDALNKMFQDKCKQGLPPLIIQVDSDGYTKFQAWDFMQIFGPFTGMCRQNAYELTIKIEVAK